MHEQNEYLTLGQATKIAPGRPSTNCLWRWCRRGVLSRNGRRVHLQHVRLGGRIYTTARWLDEFGRRLADADLDHFRHDHPAPPQRARERTSRNEKQRLAAIEQANRELEEAGV